MESEITYIPQQKPEKLSLVDQFTHLRHVLSARVKQLTRKDDMRQEKKIEVDTPSREPSIAEVVKKTDGKEELKPGNIIMANIYDIRPEETHLLSKKMVASKGACQIWVHDHFHTHDPYLTHNGENFKFPSYQRYQPKRDALIERSLTTKMPIIAFIETLGDPEKDKIILENYKKSFQQLATGQEPVTVYYVPTYYWNPTPCTFPEGIERNRTTEWAFSPFSVNRDGEWSKLLAIFKRVGINKTIVSGAYYDENEHNLSELEDPNIPDWKKDLLLSEPRKIKGDKIIKGNGCVADAIEELEKGGIKTFRSTAVLPSSYK